MTGEVRGLSRPWSERTELRFREICLGRQHRRQGRWGQPGADADTAQPSRGTRAPEGETWKPQTASRTSRKALRLGSQSRNFREPFALGESKHYKPKKFRAKTPAEEIQLFKMVNK